MPNRVSLPMRIISLTLILLLVTGALPARAEQGKSPDDLKRANRAAAILLAERVSKDRPGDYEVLRRIRVRDVLVIRGEYDRVEQVLQQVGVPFRTVAPGAITPETLRGVCSVLVNCPGRIDAKGARCLKAFVERGGFLFTTDWAVLHLIESCFPNTIRYTRRPTRDDVVAIRVVAPEHRFLHHVLTGDDHHLWWLESQSYPIEVMDRRRVEVLIESPEMARKYGGKPIAVTFRAGAGRVVHIVSHFYLQRSDLRTQRDRAGAEAFAEDLGMEKSDAARRIEREGLATVPAGELRSAYSAQQFLVNLLIEAAKDAPDVDPPSPPPPVAEPPAGRVTATRRTMLHDAPDGTEVKPVPKGLTLRVLDRRDGWVRVATPAGESGWIEASAVTDPAR